MIYVGNASSTVDNLLAPPSAIFSSACCHLASWTPLFRSLGTLTHRRLRIDARGLDPGTQRLDRVTPMHEAAVGRPQCGRPEERAARHSAP